MTRTAFVTLFFVLLATGFLTACGGNKATPVEVVISLDKTATALKTAKVTVDYSQSGATPLLRDGAPACISILPSVNCTFADDGAGTLTITASAQSSFSAPVDLAVCRMVPDIAGTEASKIASRLRVGLATGIAKSGKALDQKKLASAEGGSRKSPGAAGSGAGGRNAEGRSQPTADAPGTAPAPSGSAAATGSAAGDGNGMKVTREDLAAREARRKASEATETGTYDSSAARAARERAAAEAQAAANRAAVEDEAALDEEEPEDNDPTDSQPVAAYEVRISVTSDSGLVSALQLDISHLGSSGGWQGAGSRANCRTLVSANLNTCNDSGSGRLRCAFVDLGGFPTPSEVLSCVFKSADPVVSRGDFSVQVSDASDPQLKPIDVDVAVTSVSQR